ncbi:enoyl-CoA hydratase-related protein [Piscinibacter koreensis]|uniref:Enoyl-CoA hydratase/isomerase family protein n=1 Tax=Piscinibacter koreensis TaxID=2742824 RepID=A0A7Y6NMU9_9BURK|nr:enoyl-CoA hydratase-related protein [Schlegelella koreensis]NUZ06085.1 enoyl-CoA hydratase/isomerase family protein [Schlegelella koreensis]
MSNDILIARPAPHVGLVRIDRPEKRNALSVPLRKELVAALQSLDDDADVRAIVLAGSDRIFAAGADLSEIVDASAIDMMLRATNRMWAAIARLTKPMVAAVRGIAFGGGLELALHADLIVAGESARLGLPEIKVGLMPGAGGTQRLLRLLGRQRTLMLLLTGDALTAPEALALGIVNRVVPDDQVDAEALALAGRIAAMPPLAVRQIREVVNAGADCPLDAALMLEHKALQLLCASEDKREGIRAFLEKRTPVFTGR